MSARESLTGSFQAIQQKRGLFIPFAALTVAGSVLGIGREVYQMYEARQKAAIEHDRRDRELEARLKRLERWQCVQGWRPPDTRDSNRKCGAAEEP